MANIAVSAIFIYRSRVKYLNHTNKLEHQTSGSKQYLQARKQYIQNVVR